MELRFFCITPSTWCAPKLSISESLLVLPWHCVLVMPVVCRWFWTFWVQGAVVGVVGEPTTIMTIATVLPFLKQHDDVMKWRHLLHYHYWHFVRGCFGSGNYLALNRRQNHYQNQLWLCLLTHTLVTPAQWIKTHAITSTKYTYPKLACIVAKATISIKNIMRRYDMEPLPHYRTFWREIHRWSAVGIDPVNSLVPSRRQAITWTNDNPVLYEILYNNVTGISIVFSTVCSGANQRKHQSLASLALVRGIHRWPVNSRHKGQ